MSRQWVSAAPAGRPRRSVRVLSAQTGFCCSRRWRRLLRACGRGRGRPPAVGVARSGRHAADGA
eukprot:8199685-Pyramimonas_sp.AAC.1